MDNVCTISTKRLKHIDTERQKGRDVVDKK